MNDAITALLMAMTVFGAPALYLYIIRSSRLRLREIELAHDKRIDELTRERDLLALKVEQMEPNLEFFRQLAAGDEAPRKRVARLTQQARVATPADDTAEEDEAGSDVPAVAKPPVT